jgi:segregation and condensation protein B
MSCSWKVITAVRTFFHMNLEAKIESLLFYKAEPVAIKAIAKLAGATEGEVTNALAALEASYAGRGIVLVRKDDEVMLATSPEAAALIEAMRKEELSRDLGKAALETLTIVLYRGPISRGDIDYVRGVNSSFILRSLLIRGLVEKVQNPSDARGYLYKPTFDLLNHLGVSKIEELPGYGEVTQHLEKFKAEHTVEEMPTKEAERQVTDTDDASQ